jgi:hypothetical protein
VIVTWTSSDIAKRNAPPHDQSSHFLFRKKLFSI